MRVTEERRGGITFGVSFDLVRVKNGENRARKRGREVRDIWKKLESMLLPC